MTTIYVTKYALSSGAFKVDGQVHKPDFATYKIGNSYEQYAHKNEFFLTEQEALDDCERRRQNKIKSIEKQKSKLEKMTFTFEEVK